MKKLFCFFVALASLGAYAQSEVERGKFFDNISLGVEVGTQTNLCDWDSPNGVGLGLNVSKEFSPIIGLEATAVAGFNADANWNQPHCPYTVDNTAVLASAKVNLSNCIAGYKGEPRLVEVLVRAGAGYMHFFHLKSVGDSNHAVGKFGVDVDFNVDKSKAWTVSLRPSVVTLFTNHRAVCDNGKAASGLHNSVLQISAAVSYRFGAKNPRAKY